MRSRFTSRSSQLHRRLLPPSRRLRRSGGDPAAARLRAADRFRRGGVAVSERQPRLSRLGAAAGIFHFSPQVPGLQADRLRELMPRLRSKSIDIVFAFDEQNSRLAAAVEPKAFSLYTAPAINLFEKTTDRIPIKSNTHEYHVVPDRSRYLEYEPHRVLDVYAHFPGAKDKVPVRPLYSASVDRRPGSVEGLYFTVRRLPRRRTVEEKAHGDDLRLYRDGHVHFAARAGRTERPKGLPSNSAFAHCAPIGISRNICRSGRAAPTSACWTIRRSDWSACPVRRGRASRWCPRCGRRSEIASVGIVTWRLINMLSLNYLGLVERGAGKNAAALREMLSLFADFVEDATERKIRGVRSVDSRPVVRRIRERVGSGAARGQEITVTLDEKAFEGSGVFLLGAVLERFFADYSGFNHFTQTVVSTTGAWRDHAMAAAHGDAEVAVKLIDQMKAEPWRFDFYRCAATARAGQSRQPADRRQRRPPRGVCRSRARPLSRISGVQSCQRRGARGPAEDHRQVPRPAGSAGRAAAANDR